MEARLKVLRGADRHEIDLFLPFLIGRSADAALKIPHESVSREHCRIYEFDGELAVRDLGSRNGTLVNGQQIDKPTFLAPGDELTVGGVTFQADYQIRRQVIVQPHEESAARGEETNTVGADSETVARTDVGRTRSTEKDSRIDGTAARKKGSAPKKRSKTKDRCKKDASLNAAAAANAIVPIAKTEAPASDIPQLEQPAPTVAEVPVLNLEERPAPIVDEVHLDTEAPIELVREDELKGFLDELS